MNIFDNNKVKLCNAKVNNINRAAIPVSDHSIVMKKTTIIKKGRRARGKSDEALG